MTAAELIKLTAADGVELHGGLCSSSGEPRLGADAALFLHGAGSNFYSSSLLRGILPPLLQNGVSVLALNTRGHDAVCTLKTSHGGRRGGAAFEVVDECQHDVRGALDFLVKRGFEKIALIGHSLGALKALYAQSRQPHEHASHVVAISPPRLSYAAFCRGPRREEFLATIAHAEQFVREGQGDRLMEVTIPLPLLITAAGYLDKYGPGERYSLANFIGQVAQPAIYIFGEKELASGASAFAGLDDEIRQNALQNSTPTDVAVIPQADHFYTGCHQALISTMVAWQGWA